MREVVNNGNTSCYCVKTVITPTDLLSKMPKRMVPGVHETLLLLVVPMAQKRGLFGLQEETNHTCLKLKCSDKYLAQR
jgi:hypothetical protein